MKKKKTGFTIVELVIVIAVIAILAAVLIPTFSAIVRKASISGDISMAKNLNTALAIYGAENDPNTIDSYKNNRYMFAYDAVIDGGYSDEDLIPKTEDVYFVYERSSNQFLLVEALVNKEDGTVSDPVVLFNINDYPELPGGENEAAALAEEEEFVPTWCFWVDDETKAKLITNPRIELYATFWCDEQIVFVTLEENIQGLIIRPGEKVTYNLGGNNISGEKYVSETALLKNWIIAIVNNGGDATINGNGTLSTKATGFYLPENSTGKLELNNLTIKYEGSAQQYAGYVFGGEAILNDVTFESYEAGLNIQYGDVIFNSGKLHLVSTGNTNPRHCFYIAGDSTLTINGGDFDIGDPAKKRAYICTEAGATVYVNGGTFGNPSNRTSDGIFPIMGEGNVIITGGTFGFDPSTWVASGYKAEYSGTTWTVQPE